MNANRLIRLLAFALLFALLLMAGCQESPSPATPVPTPTPTSLAVKVCTERDCGQTLTVQFAGTLPDDFTLEAAAGNRVMEVRCVAGQGEYGPRHFDTMSYLICTGGQVAFVNFSPDEVTLTLRWPENEVTQTFTPEYTTFLPNGADCPPACRRGNVTLKLPGS